MKKNRVVRIFLVLFGIVMAPVVLYLIYFLFYAEVYCAHYDRIREKCFAGKIPKRQQQLEKNELKGFSKLENPDKSTWDGYTRVFVRDTAKENKSVKIVSYRNWLNIECFEAIYDKSGELIYIFGVYD